jgi:uncharacterized DUF497 family protein
MSDDFEWDQGNLRHIAEHDVSPEEAEYVLLHDPVELEYQDWHGDEERFQEVGVTASGRFLVVLSTVRGIRLRVLTAYDAPNYAMEEYLRNR